MKAVIIILGISLGLILGMFPTLGQKKPAVWKLAGIFMVSLTIILAILPPIAGTFADSYEQSKNSTNKAVNVKFKVVNEAKQLKNNLNEKEVRQFDAINPDDVNKTVFQIVYIGNSLPDELKPGNTIIAKLEFQPNEKVFEYISTESVNPILSLPFVPNLGEKARILNFHVPCAWLAVLAYLVSMVFSVRYLKSRDHRFDIIASSSAVLGTLFCILATITGAVWAKFNWGSYWNWDPRETSIFVLLLIYGAYFALRAAIDKEELKARLSSIYAIIAFITVPFFVFVLPRITTGLHPGSLGEGNSGPILSAKPEMLDFTKQIIFSLSFASFMFIYFWLLNITIRLKTAELKINY